MGSVEVVVGPPGREACPDVRERGEQGLVEEFVPQPSVEALDEGILDRLARGDVVPVDPGAVGEAQDGVRGELVPLSLTIMPGLPRVAMSASSSRATRSPDSDVSATSARHSRVQSSTTVSTLKRRQSVI